MSGPAHGWVIRNSPLASANERWLLSVISEASHDDGTGCCESEPELARLTNLSRGHVRRLIASAESHGYLEVARGTGRGHVSQYRLTMPDAQGATLQDVARRHRKGDQKVITQDPFTPPERGSKGDQKVIRKDQAPHGFDTILIRDPDPIGTGLTNQEGEIAREANAAKRAPLDRSYAIMWAEQHGLKAVVPRGVEAELEKFLIYQDGHNWTSPPPQNLMWADENQAWRKWCLDMLDRDAKSKRLAETQAEAHPWYVDDFGHVNEIEMELHPDRPLDWKPAGSPQRATA